MAQDSPICRQITIKIYFLKMKGTYKLIGTTTETKSKNLTLIKIFTLFVFNLQNLFLNIVSFFAKSKARNVVIVGQGNSAKALLKFFGSKKAHGYQLKGVFNISNQADALEIDEIKNYCIEEEIEEIYFAENTENQNLIQDFSKFADQNFIYLRITTDNQVVTDKAQDVNTYYFNDVPVMSVRKEPLASRFNQGLKRAFDIVFSLGVLAILIPFVFPIIALAIRLESRGPIFFKQNRPGKKNKLFKCWKFRSMTVNNSGEQQATKNDKRITKVGAFLRKTSLDELPQFINVLLGDMSVVGPRPNMVKQLEYYSTVIDNYSFRHFVTPGITGLAQVNGFRGETQTIDLMEKRVEYDIKYMQTWSFWLDIKIIFLTGYNIVKGEENAY